VRTSISGHALTFIFITVFLDMVGMGLIFPVLPRLIMHVSGLTVADSTAVGGWLFVSYVGMQFLFGPLIGNLSDRFGRRPLLLIAIAGLGIDYFLSAFAPNLAWLFAGRLLAGICGATYHTANAFIADVTPPEKRAAAFGLMGAAFGLGFVLGPAIGGLLGTYGPRVPFFAAALLACLNFLYGLFVLPETLPPERRRQFEFWRANPLGTLKVFRNYPSVLPLCTVLFTYYAAVSVYPAIWAFWAVARLAWDELTTGLTLAAFGLLTAATQGLLTGPAIGKFGERGTIIMALACAIMGAAGFGLASGLAIVLAVTVINAPEGLADPALVSAMSHQAPADAQGELQGGIASAKSLAMLLATPLFAEGFAFSANHYGAVAASHIIFGAAALALFGAMLLFIFIPRQAHTAGSIPQ
jgi:DHA1 family tetracycline resistance protein-like MFS transporter